MISPRLSSTRGDLGPEILRRELLAYDPPCAGRGQGGSRGNCSTKGSHD